MKLESTFFIPASPERVFSSFLEPEVILASLPGLEQFTRVDEETFRGTLRNEVAHVKFNAAFTATLQEVDDPRLVVAKVQGEDRRLASSIKADARLAIEPSGDGSQVDYGLEVALWGPIGRVGEAIVRRRTAEIQEEFVRRFSRVCQGLPAQPDVATPAEPERPVARATDADPAAATSPDDGRAGPGWRRWVGAGLAGVVLVLVGRRLLRKVR
jgi:carbon monoxide dehydrogenase subunit G